MIIETRNRDFYAAWSKFPISKFSEEVPKRDRYKEMKRRTRQKQVNESTYNSEVFKVVDPDEFHFKVFEALSEVIIKLLSLKSNGEW